MKIVNITASGNLGYPVDLLAAALRFENSEYEPERCAGLIIRRNENLIIRLYSSGKFVVIGAKKIKELKEAEEFLIKHLKN